MVRHWVMKKRSDDVWYALVEEVQEVYNQNEEDFPKQVLVPTGTYFSYLKCATTQHPQR